jgi:predicted TIM-barrel fold metal-dependent hydrolase
MKLWVATFCDDPRAFPLVEKCIEYKIPVLVHAFYKSIGQLEHESLGKHVASLARRYPEAKIIMAHLSSNCYLGIKEIEGCKNVYSDICGSIFRRDEVDYSVSRLGAERILFGTDMPGSYLVNLGQVEEADLTPEQREMIYYRNALRILDRS